MLFTLRRTSLLVLAPLLLVALAASGCDSPAPATNDGASVCVGKAPPPLTPGFRMKLSVVDFGDPTRTDRWRTLGFNYDGLCSTEQSLLACRRRAGGRAPEEGDAGIDNAFGLRMIEIFTAFVPYPSASWSGGSFLELDDAGNGLLLLVDESTAYRVPLRHARIEAFDGAGGVLGAIVPLAEFAAMFGDDISAVDTQLCGGSNRATVEAVINGAADIPVTGVPAPGAECDGISLGLRFRGAPVDALPAARPNPCATDAGSDAAP